MTLDELAAGIRTALLLDGRVSHALAYGSRTQRPGGHSLADEFSDLEYYVYTGAVQSFNPHSWLEKVTPLLLYVVNPFGTPNAVTPELHRIELHVVSVSRMPDLLDWPNGHADPAAMLVKDTDGQLQALLQRFVSNPPFDPGPPQAVLDDLLNWLTFGSAVLRRGERLRALELLSWVRGGLIRLCRFAEHTEQPRAVTRAAERHLSAVRLQRLSACSAGVDALEPAYRAALTLAAELAAALGLDGREALVQALCGRLNEATPP
ncbi:hypothetical protein [Deinococcus sp.]|uniref:hypothetical protein n=1 Tax=Deinococcus sp. TaxID=47478 RepID=UPI003CC68EB5